ncbi:MAG: phage tail protein, partial [Paucimonas sp.]|nr:phage tail protein [Paucimonas sp.]
LVVAPDAVLLDKNECVEVQQAMLDHCGEKMKNRLAILDIHGGDKPRNHPAGDRIADFRNAIGTATLSHGAAYYPWLQATVTNATDFSFHDFSDRTLLRTLLEAEQASIRQAADNGPAPADELAALIAGITQENEGGVQKSLRHKTLLSISKLYGQLLAAAARKVNTLPPSAAIAGIYTMVDNACGVWKAPANIGINSITRPIVNITNEEQEDLNVPLDGKSVNAIRAFINEGVLVWGARTLDGNSQDWRYISVRRTMIMLEESIKRAAAAYVFEPNVANTWVTIKSMMRNYLTSVWKRGGLAGATPDDAFSVSVGLGETMTPEDILEGLMRVTVLVAPTRPAEFIELTFQQQMQKS